MSPSAACVITGAGIVSPLGTGLEANRAALRAGAGHIAPIQAFSAGLAADCAGEVTDPAVPRGQERAEAMARMALAECCAQAGLDAGSAPDPRRALSFAIGKATVDLEALAAAGGDAAARARLEQHRAHFDAPALLPRLARACAAGGPQYSSYTACASGNDAVGLAMRLIQRGEADVVIAGATDAQVHPLSLLEFELLSALSHEPAARACRPFDRNRTGFVVGEGAAALVVESAEHAARRGAPAVASLAGYGSSLDAHGLTKCHPQGRGAALAMRAALADAGLQPRHIDYINAHGTGTVLNDQAEAAAIAAVWGDAVASVPVSSTKAMTGHLLTAASAVEAVLTALALQDGVLPLNLNFEQADADCRLNIIAAPGRRARMRFAMSNGFGFGGQNSSLILAFPSSLS